MEIISKLFLGMKLIEKVHILNKINIQNFKTYEAILN
jgi:hypothetical protein